MDRISAFGDEIAFDLEDQITKLQEHGLQALELRSAWGVNVVDLTPQQLKTSRRLLDEAGLAVSAIGSPVGKTHIEGDFELELTRLRAAFAAADSVGTSLIRIFSFIIPPGRHAEFRNEVLRRVSIFAREAQAHGKLLVHENDSDMYGDDAERCRDLVESIASPALKVTFDPANFVQVGVRPYDEAWPLLAGHIAHFHVKDAVAVVRDGVAPELQLGMSVRPAGEGEGQLPELMRALEAGGYQGFLVLEPHLQLRLHEMEMAEQFEVALAALHKVLAQPSPKKMKGLA